MLTTCAAKLTAASVLGGVFLFLLTRKRNLSQDHQDVKVVAITGCDSGVGYSIAYYCHNQGLRVVAMVLSPSSHGAKILSELGKISGRIEVIQVDVTKPEQVSTAIQYVNNALDNKKSLVFHALINNAGVMVFGETEWQTEHTMSLQLDVNLVGAIRVTRMFASLLRKYKGRVINITSHCASLPLPGLAVYAASKAGLQAWSDALRVEWAKYGITVISLIPGAFFQQTNILSRQMNYAREMQEAMTVETAAFYGNYYNEYQQYLSALAGDKPTYAIQDEQLYFMMYSALFDISPQPHYHNTPWRYSLYHILAGIAPTALRDKLVSRFTAMPDFNP